MRQLKYEIPGLLLALSLLVISNEINGNTVKYALLTAAVIAAVVLAYFITKDITGFISASMANREANIDKIALELKDSIGKYSEEQSKNTNQLVEIVEKFSGATSQYMDRVDSLATIQNSIIEEGKVLNGEVKSLNTDVHKLLEEFSAKINSTLAAFCADFSEIQKKANENEIENLSSTRTAIEEYMNKYETVLNETKDSLNVLKSQVKVSMDQANKAIREQTSSIEDGLEDCADEIGAKLGDFSKDQKNRDNEQNTKLNEEIKVIEKVVSSQIGQVLEANEKLLVYIQKVQDEWTSLSKDEIAFLNKVWNE